MPPTAEVVDPINIPGAPELSPDRVLLLVLKEVLADLQDNLPADQELARWIEATSVSIHCPPVEKEMIHPVRPFLSSRVLHSISRIKSEELLRQLSYAINNQRGASKDPL